jgi:succinyl-diaminopimelate desuccinylase
MDDREKVFQIIEKKRQDMIRLQTSLSVIPAIAPQSGGKGEWEKATLLLETLKNTGISDIRIIEAPDNRVDKGSRPNIVATIPGADKTKNFWIMTHMDVVPPGELRLWSSDPFTVIEKNGRLIGRGVEDNQQGIVSSLFAVLSLIEAGLQPFCTVRLLFVADEETGSEYGIKYLADNHSLFSKNDLILVPDSGNQDGSFIEVAEKNLLWIKFRIVGKQCHASTPELGINAFVAGSDLVGRLYGLNTIFSGKNPIFDPPVSTFSPTKKEANVPNINTIPGEDIFYLDCRILPSIDMKDVFDRITGILRDIKAKYNVHASYDIIEQSTSPATPGDTPLVGYLKKAIREVYGVEGKVGGIGGGTVAAHLRRKGFDTVVWSKIDDAAHMPNEYCIIDNMIGNAKVMAAIMLGI